MKINKYPQKEYKRIYGIYHGMKQRCLNSNSPRYKDYGGRGIIICAEWLYCGEKCRGISKRTSYKMTGLIFDGRKESRIVRSPY